MNESLASLSRAAIDRYTVGRVADAMLEAEHGTHVFEGRASFNCDRARCRSIIESRNYVLAALDGMGERRAD